MVKSLLKIIEEKNATWRKRALQSKGLKVNINKIKAMAIRPNQCRELANNGVDLCKIQKRVMRNSIQCHQSEYQIHKQIFKYLKVDK